MAHTIRNESLIRVTYNGIPILVIEDMEHSIEVYDCINLKNLRDILPMLQKKIKRRGTFIF